jgi:hypothetical protein
LFKTSYKFWAAILTELPLLCQARTFLSICHLFAGRRVGFHVDLALGSIWPVVALSVLMVTLRHKSGLLSDFQLYFGSERPSLRVAGFFDRFVLGAKTRSVTRIALRSCILALPKQLNLVNEKAELRES